MVGDPLDDATDVSALISPGRAGIGCESWIDEAVAGGAKVASRRHASDNGVLAPTVLTERRNPT